VIGLVLALAVVAIIVSLVGQWIVGIAIGVVALIVFALALAGFGRRSTSPRRPSGITPRCYPDSRGAAFVACTLPPQG
jgi:hypothetical protein